MLTCLVGMEHVLLTLSTSDVCCGIEFMLSAFIVDFFNAGQFERARRHLLEEIAI